MWGLLCFFSFVSSSALGFGPHVFAEDHFLWSLISNHFWWFFIKLWWMQEYLKPIQTCTLKPSLRVLRGPPLFSFSFTKFSGTQKHWTQVSKCSWARHKSLRPLQDLQWLSVSAMDVLNLSVISAWSAQEWVVLPLPTVVAGKQFDLVVQPSSSFWLCWHLWIKQVSFYPEPVFAELCCMHNIICEIKLSVSALT